MNQVELAQHLSKCTGIAGSICGAVVGELFNLIRASIERNETVVIKGFGTFRPSPVAQGYEIGFEPERFAQGKPVPADDGGVIELTEKRRLKLDSERMTTLKMIEDATLEGDAEEAVEATEADLDTPPPPDKPGYKIATRSGLNPSARSGVNPSAVSKYAEPIVIDGPTKSGMRKAAKGGRNKAESSPGMPKTVTSEGLSSFASEILGLDKDEMERGLGLAEGVNPVSKGRRLTFPVQISRQALDNISKRYRPADGEERRQFKDLALKNFFMSLGSIVRERESHEPLIVFDVDAKRGSEGERYVIKLLRVSGRIKTGKKSSTRAVSNPEELRFEEIEFDPEKHEVLIVIDEAQGPRIHGFDIGGFKDNDRHDRAEICLAQEYESFHNEKA
ncbi:MAG: HU family DNA-binding protein [Planctomycetes bacterium]|nr:HU family DNA-binding protein [Planctomycetota bacterium]